MKRDLVVAGTQHHHVRLLKINIIQDDRARLVSSNQECFTHYKHMYISYFFNKYSLSLYVYTQGLLALASGPKPYLWWISSGLKFFVWKRDLFYFFISHIVIINQWNLFSKKIDYR